MRLRAWANDLQILYKMCGHDHLEKPKVYRMRGWNMNDVAIVVDMCLHSLVKSMRMMNYTSITKGQIEMFVNHLGMVNASNQNAWLKQTLTTLLEVIKKDNRKDISVAELEILIEINKEQE